MSINKYSKEEKKNRSLVFAHYHLHGLIRTDTLDLLEEARHYFNRIIFVSTKLDQSQLARFPHDVEIHLRENVGYDFYSYRHGLKLLIDGGKDWVEADVVCIMNSSFLCFDARKFYEQIFKNEDAYSDAFGVTKSYEKAEHLQSYLIGFKRNLLGKREFVEWWLSMAPINERSKVITKYEIGLSKLIIGLDCELRAILNCENTSHRNANGRHAEERLMQLFSEVARFIRKRKLNPSHIFWENILENFGIIKIDLIKSNHFNVDLGKFFELIENDKRYKNLVLEGLNN